MLYHAFQLNFDSELVIPEFAIMDNSDYVQPDVSIQVVSKLTDAPYANANPSTLFEITPNEFWLNIPNIARYWVKSGSSIVIEPYHDADEASIRAFLLTTPMAMLLQQRGYVVLRASAVKGKDGAILFAGQSLGGKSTLAAYFVQQGYQLIADEICAIQNKSDGLCLLSAYPTQYLWRDALEHLDLTNLDSQVRLELDMYCVGWEDSFCVSNQPIDKIYILNGAEYNTAFGETTEVRGMHRLSALVEHGYVTDLYNVINQKQTIMRQLMNLLTNDIPIAAINVNHVLQSYKQAFDAISRDLEDE